MSDQQARNLERIAEQSGTYTSAKEDWLAAARAWRRSNAPRALELYANLLQQDPYLKEARDYLIENDETRALQKVPDKLTHPAYIVLQYLNNFDFKITSRQRRDGAFIIQAIGSLESVKTVHKTIEKEVNKSYPSRIRPVPYSRGIFPTYYDFRPLKGPPCNGIRIFIRTPEQMQAIQDALQTSQEAVDELRQGLQSRLEFHDAITNRPTH